MSTKSQYHADIAALGFRILGTSNGHLVVEHPTRGIRTHIAGTPDGNVSARKSIGKLRTALSRGASTVDVFVDWLCHEYEVGPDECKLVHLNLPNEARRFVASDCAPRRKGGLPPSAAAVEVGARDHERLEMVRRAHGGRGVKGALGEWRVMGARYGLGPAPEPEANGNGVAPLDGRLWPDMPAPEAVAEVPIVAPTPEEYAERLASWAPAEAPATDVAEPIHTRPDAALPPASGDLAELANLVAPMRALLWPDMAARDELVRDGLREVLHGLDTAIAGLEETRRACHTLLGLASEAGANPTRGTE